MSGKPVLGPAPIVSHPQPPEKKVDSEADLEALLEQYEDMKLGSEEGEKSFIWPEGKRPDIVYDKFDFKLPVIDLSPVLKLQSLRKEIEQSSDGESKLRSGLEEEMEACNAAQSILATAIRAAFEEYGFFQIINHGFDMKVVDQLTECFRQIFDRPLEEKMKVKQQPFPDRPAVPGYFPMKRNTAYTRTAPAHVWSESMDLESPEKFYVGRLEQIADSVWPGEPEKHRLFRSSVDEYGKQSSRVTVLLMDLIAVSLAIPEDSVKSLLGDPHKRKVNARLRINNYPVCIQPEMTWGLHGHTDSVLITLLHQDEVGGLQIRFRDGTWHGVQPIPGAFVINCGDFLQAWTNNRFLSAEHRVVANKKSRRMSIAYFAFSEPNYVICPRPECIDDEHPVLYKPFTMLDYVKAIETFGVPLIRGELLDKAFGISGSLETVMTTFPEAKVLD